MSGGQAMGRVSDSKTGEELLEEAATALLREAGVLRRSEGIRTARSERTERRRCVCWEEWQDARTAAPGLDLVWEELDALARAARLTPEEKEMLALAQVEGRSLREAAKAHQTTVYRVRSRLARALRKCARRERDAPLSARALFYEEIRQKEAAIYRPPYRVRRAARRG